MLNLQVLSKYKDSNSFIFYIKEFTDIIKYLFLAQNYNTYYLIITNENEETINNINFHLLNNKRHPEFERSNLFIVCSTQEHINWCNNNNLNFVNNDNIPEITDSFSPVSVNKPGWAFQNHQLFLEYYKDTNIKIIHIEGLEHNWNIIPYLKNNIHIFVTWPCYFSKWNYEFTRNTLYTLNKEYNTKNIIWLSPDLDGILWAYEYKYNSILCNQNCFIDYNKFNIENTEIIYDAVMNCRPELWKRPYLAEEIENLAYIKGAVYGQKEIYDYTKLTPKFMNNERIDMNKVKEIYNKSYCGLIFSESEGACYSSSEYLLCGLPVISTESRGGRNTWYNKNNSIIVEPDKIKVKEAVEICIKNIKNNTFNKKNIRNSHIELSNLMRQKFNECIQQIFNDNNIHLNANEYWNTNYFHKMQYKINTTDCIQILIN
jgi:glycosyltransferase involved in cell wall biosynthesis